MLRIRGLVKAARAARESLRDGIPPNRIERFRHMVRESVATVERLCAAACVTPQSLPTPSRKAYDFLRGIDLEHLPMPDREQSDERARPIQIKHVTRNCRAILSQICDAAASAEPGDGQQTRIAGDLQRLVADIEAICASRDTSPGGLPGPSRNAYSLMKFLTAEANLERHIDATRRATRIAQQIISTRNLDPPEAVVEFRAMAGVWQHRRYRDVWRLRANIGLVAADDVVLHAVVRSMLVGRSRPDDDIIEVFLASEEYGDVLLELDLEAELTAEEARGRTYDLGELFGQVNQEYFRGEESRPRLTWTQRLTSRRFGYYERTRDRIVVSVTLDDAQVPRYVVEFVVYHELLHRRHPARWLNGRHMSHTREFRENERQFAQYEEADEWLKRLAAS